MFLGMLTWTAQGQKQKRNWMEKAFCWIKQLPSATVTWTSQVVRCLFYLSEGDAGEKKKQPGSHCKRCNCEFERAGQGIELIWNKWNKTSAKLFANIATQGSKTRRSRVVWWINGPEQYTHCYMVVAQPRSLFGLNDNHAKILGSLAKLQKQKKRRKEVAWFGRWTCLASEIWIRNVTC